MCPVEGVWQVPEGALYPRIPYDGMEFESPAFRPRLYTIATTEMSWNGRLTIKA